MNHKLFLFTILLHLSTQIFALEQDTTVLGSFSEVTLIAPRINKQLLWTGSRDTMQLSDVYQNNLRTALDSRTGIQSFNGENFAQDLRISIRGFGSRSAFGVRGIRIYLDDIPLTAPDGTSQMDEVSIFDISSLETVRSGLAARLGNAGGGAISFGTSDFSNEQSPLQIRTRANSLGAYDLGVKLNTNKNKVANMLTVNHHRFDSKRSYSQARTTSIYNKTKFVISDKLEMTLIGGFYYSPEGKDPGALTKVQFDENRWQANSRNMMFLAGETVKGHHVAIKTNLDLNEKTRFKSLLFYRKRDFEGKLPNENGGIVHLGRDFVGMTNSMDWAVLKNVDFLLGHTIEFQEDLRTLFRNILGTQAEKQTDQLESVFNNAVFQQFQWSKGNFNMHQLLRYDYNTYKLKDLFGIDGFQNGGQNFSSLNGGLGFGYQFKNLMAVFTNISTSFEMPTLNELSNNPNGLSDFNTSLNPEKSLHWEIGVRSNEKSSIKWALSFFNINLKNQIQGYEISSFPGKVFYRNAAQSKRNGIEVEMSTKLFSKVDIGFNYTYAHFQFVDYVVNNQDYSGNFQPIVPNHKCNLRLSSPLGDIIDANLNVSFNSSMWLDDANLSETGTYVDMNFVLATTPSLLKKVLVGVQVNNLFNTLQYSNFRANAVAGRYFEAASPMHFGLFAQYKL
jgi:iron complex outermembrane receptor protein